MGACLRIAVVTVCVIASLVAAPSAHAAFPGANGKIAFAAYRDATYEIYTMNADGSNQTRLTNNTAFDFDPAWSPDGTKIAFVTDRDGGWPYEIYTMNADGTNQTRLTNNVANDLSPAWSPDGTKIAFNTNRDGSYEIYTMNADGTNPTRLTNNTGGDVAPAWSPDGTKIAFNTTMSQDGVRPYEIYIMNADGSNQTRLTNNTAVDQEPAWSPDGTKIAFTAFRDPYLGYEIYTMNADGSNQTPIGALTGDNFVPDWQPIPNRPPDCSGVAASRPVLGTPNHRLVPITLDGATDPDADPVTLSVDGVTQDEPVVGSGDNTSPDAVYQGDGQLRIRAERNPHGDGRVYRIAFTASDGRGGSCSGAARVSVPRTKRKPAVDSAPPSYDSFDR